MELVPVLFLVLLSIGLVASLVKSVRTHRIAGALMREGAAFDEKVVPHPFDRTQIERLRPLVSQVGVLALENQEPNESRPQERYFHVFVIDIEGAIHDVIVTGDATHASRTARGLAQHWDVPLDDQGGVLS